MSHITTIKVEIMDLDALDEACKPLGLELRRGQKKYRWYGSQPKACEHAIGIPKTNNYEVGVVRQGNSLGLAYDPYDHELSKKVGPGCGNIIAAYSKVMAKKQARLFANAQGWTMSETFDEATQETVITLRKYD
jgi:hypothetical protein